MYIESKLKYIKIMEDLVCTCTFVTEEEINYTIDHNKEVTIDSIADITSAGTGCGKCRKRIQELIDLKNKETTNG